MSPSTVCSLPRARNAAGLRARLVRWYSPMVSRMSASCSDTSSAGPPMLVAAAFRPDQHQDGTGRLHSLVAAQLLTPINYKLLTPLRLKEKMQSCAVTTSRQQDDACNSALAH